jgi:hypothetical protein
MLMRSATLWRDKLFLRLGLGKRHNSFPPADVYSETDYRDLIRRESKRSAQSGHLCWILLVYCTNVQELVVTLESELAGKMISVLSMSIRDTDYVGWYRQGRILGVLLTALQPESARDGCDTLKVRLADCLRDLRISADDHFVQIRVFEPGELTAFNAFDDPAPLPGSKD